ncbi:MAG: acyl-CoA dehydrogenase family protein [Myxococcales bacterium]|nr:acyl-CoA dehydrogenase family protein [Myxococcales bacterium]MCB9629160.1 acyl-CoA dehydrogenase family protein [Sandaracinaceae bacterium]
MEALLRHLLGEDPRDIEVPDLVAWWDSHDAARGRFARPLETAVAAGFRADRLGYAFASGYVCALEHLLPELGGVPAALAVTESAGNRPRDITTTLTAEGDAFRLSGEKTFVTLGEAADQLVIIARDASETERVALVAVRIPRSRVGVTLVPAAPAAFVPEIPHSRATFAGVRVTAEERLDGDGYLAIMKPFRTVEDIFVHAAILGLLVRYGRQAVWPHGVIERLVSAIVALGGIADLPPLAPTTHLALAGVLETTGRFLDGELPSLAQQLPPTARERLFRDAAIFGVAARARAQRRVTAWASLAPA